MSYHVYLFAKRTRVDNEASATPDWLEDQSALALFSSAERGALVERLSVTGFSLATTDGAKQTFENQDIGASALLDDRGLYLSASGVDGIFEIGMFASELAAEFAESLAKFDPQDGTWEP